MKPTKEASKITLEEIVSALHEKGYEPYEQIYGYLKTGLEQLCEALGGISTKIGYKMIKEKKINSIKVGREYRVCKIDLVDFFMNIG